MSFVCGVTKVRLNDGRVGLITDEIDGTWLKVQFPNGESVGVDVADVTILPTVARCDNGHRLTDVEMATLRCSSCDAGDAHAGEIAQRTAGFMGC
jgi:Zn finger protein HypA/HybF involved in hydrogenase expression